MTKEIVQQFANSEFGTLRTAGTAEKPEFCAKDVAKALGYKNTNDAIKRHCKGVVKRYPLETSGGVQELAFIGEGDMYRLIASSKLESAQRFESWVFDEVLPAIRRDGGYMVAGENETPEQTMARALLIAKDALDRKDARIAELEPKALFADAVAASDGTCLIGELAKMLRQNGTEIGQNRLFAWMRDNGYLGKSGSNRNVPTQRAMEMGIFRIKETAVTHSDGHVTVNRTPKVTGRGQRYFIERAAQIA
jgi:anti-repressor protein